MCSLSADDSRVLDTALSRWRVTAEVGLIFLIFFIEAAWPPPDVGESHYLSKARHYWDATWCARDFFCSTADAHLVFYWTFGWLSRFLPLATMAWCGRLLTWWLLAWSWRRMSGALVPSFVYPVLSAALFVTLNDRCQMAGEWVVGGVEAKGFAYVFVFLAIEALVRGRWARACLLLGAASAFHVLVGGWALVAVGVVWLASPDRPPLTRMVLPLAGGLVLALPGLLPALVLNWRVGSGIVAEANRIYVFERLPHHLLPQWFPPQFVIRHMLLVCVLVVLVRFAPADSRFRKLCAFVAAAIGLAAIGMAIGLLIPIKEDLSVGLLRYYWFRMSDVMVPLGVALIAGAIICNQAVARPRWHLVGLSAALLLVSAHLADVVWWRHRHMRPPADASIDELTSWREMCDWAATETPTDALFLTPRLAQTFRWYAGRSEVVSRKDVPQDAAGIVEWWRRLNRIYATDLGSREVWRESLAELGATRLNELGAEFGADYVITAAYPVVNLQRVGPLNGSFAIYRLAPPAGIRATATKP